MKRLFFFIFILLLLWPSFGQGALSDPTVLVVTKEVHLSRKIYPYQFSRIEVRPDGFLIIEPGVRVELFGGGTIQVDGFLQAAGTPEEPVVITSHNAIKWKGLSFSANALLAWLRYVEISNFVDPIEFNNYQPLLEYVTVRNGTHNSIHFTHQDSIDYGIYLGHLTFQVDTPAARTEQKIVLKGPFYPIVFDDIQFRDTHPFYLVDWQDMGIFSEGDLSLIVEEELVRFPFNCSRKITQGDHRYSMVPDMMNCRPQLDIPTIFVPGYGTSLNLFQLTKDLQSQPDLDGWAFSKYLIPAYGEFLEDFRKNDAQVEVAFYDWRLPIKEAAQKYLVPLIEEVKRRYQVDQVNIVAHSYGGLVSRAYIQGDSYAHDVSQFVELGTPNLGAAKAYSAWAGGVLPPDWAVLYNLLTFYNFRFARSYSYTEAIHHFFPSARDLLPIYPAILRKGEVVDPDELEVDNPDLEQLKEGLDKLYERTRVTSVVSQSELTVEKVALGPPQPSGGEWPDGRLWVLQPEPQKSGDGTVPLVSAALPGAERIEVTGNHNNLVASAAEPVFNLLYPWKSYRAPTVEPFEPGISFFFDCPIEVTVTSPSGAVVSSEKPVSAQGEVFTSDDLLWFILPKEVGTYVIQITAKEDTLARWWVDRGIIGQKWLRKGEMFTTSYPSVQKVSMSAQLVLPTFPQFKVPKPLPVLQFSDQSLKTSVSGEQLEPPLDRRQFYLILSGIALLCLAYMTWAVRVVLRE